jgi:DNA primase
MAVPRIHPATIEEVKERVDIVEIVSEHVVLKKRGKNYLGLCPFHNEKTPSFTVNPAKQFYHCFGCGAGGNGFKFLMEIGKQGFAEVVLDLARRYQVNIQTLEPEKGEQFERELSIKEQLYEILAIATSFFEHALRQPQGQTALDYVQHQRKLDGATIQKFQLGYAPAGWETLYQYLVEQKRYPVSLVEQAGLIKPRQKGNGFYDQFRDRLMIPIRDLQGRVIAFGSRTLTGQEPKYLNSPETLLFNKGKTLYGFDQAKQAIASANRAIIVEGYFDVIAMQTHGLEETVAVLGTAFSQYQLKQLLRYCDSKQVIFNFDADRAGVKATQRAIEEIAPLVYSGQVQLRILNLPDGKDADEFLTSSPTAVDDYRQALDQAPLWLDWHINQILLDRDLNQGDQFQQVAKELVALLGQISDRNQRIYYVTHCAELLAQGNAQMIAVHSQNLLTQLNQGDRSTKSQGRSKTSTLREKPNNKLEKIEAVLLRIYFHDPSIRTYLVELIEAKDLVFTINHHRRLWEKLLEIKDHEPIAPEQILDGEDWPPEELQLLHSILYLNENTEPDVDRSLLQIQAAIASMEIINQQAYRQHCIDCWQAMIKSDNPNVEMLQLYQQEIATTALKIQELQLSLQVEETQLEINLGA